MKKGPPKGYVFKPLEERFWAKVAKTDADLCWPWTAWRSKAYPGYDYGFIKVNGRRVLAHRVSWILHYGPIPESIMVCHRCDNPPCVNPNHLFLGTCKDNLSDMLVKGRSAGQKGTRFQPDVVGERNGRARLTIKDVQAIRQDKDTSPHDLAMKFNVGFTTIYHVLNGDTWKNVL